MHEITGKLFAVNLHLPGGISFGDPSLYVEIYQGPISQLSDIMARATMLFFAYIFVKMIQPMMQDRRSFYVDQFHPLEQCFISALRSRTGYEDRTSDHKIEK